MKTKLIILSFLISLICTGYSQNEKNNWHFGYNAGITFNTNPPSYIMSGSTQQEGSSSISDAAGNTILYGGGNKLYDNTSLISNTPVSYTHLTLPTILLV